MDDTPRKEKQHSAHLRRTHTHIHTHTRAQREIFSLDNTAWTTPLTRRSVIVSTCDAHTHTHIRIHTRPGTEMVLVNTGCGKHGRKNGCKKPAKEQTMRTSLAAPVFQRHLQLLLKVLKNMFIRINARNTTG